MKKNNRLFELFAGELVSIMLDKDVEHSVQSSDRVETMKTCLSAVGYLVDCDDVYYYLGATPDNINQAVPKEWVVHLEQVVEESINDGLLQAGELPTKPEGYN